MDKRVIKLHKDLMYIDIMNTYKLSLSDFYEFVRIYNHLVVYGYIHTLYGNVAEVMEKYKFDVKQEGIGFKISL